MIQLAILIFFITAYYAGLVFISIWIEKRKKQIFNKYKTTQHDKG